MGKLILLTLTTIDGCASNLEGIKEWGLKRDLYGVSDIYNNSDGVILDSMYLEQIDELLESTDTYCVYEPEPGKEKFTQRLFENRLIDEMYLYIFSYTMGAGIPLFSYKTRVSDLWKLVEAKVYNEDIIRLHYIRVNEDE